MPIKQENLSVNSVDSLEFNMQVFEPLFQKLDDALASKKNDETALNLLNHYGLTEPDDMRKFLLSSEDHKLKHQINPNEAKLLEQYGLTHPDDIATFLLSPTGQELKHEISMELERQEEAEEELQLEIQEQTLERARIRQFLFEWLLEEKDEAKKLQADFETQEKQLKEEKAAQKKIDTPASAPAPSAEPTPTEDVLQAYNEAVKDYIAQQEQLQEEEQLLSSKLDHLNKETGIIELKHKAYEKNFASFEKRAKIYENNPTKLDNQITSLKKQMEALSVKIDAQLTKGDEKKARSYLNKQNALGLELASLEDIKASKSENKDEKKVFLDAKLEVTTQENAAFVLPEKQQNQLGLHKGAYYLLKPGEQLDKDNADQLKTAIARYEKAKPEIMSVKNLVHDVKKQEQKLNTNQIEAAQSKLSVNKGKQLMVKNQVSFIHSAQKKADPNLKQSLTPAPLKMQPPKSSIRNEKNYSNAFVKTVTGPHKTPWSSVFSFVKTVEERDIVNDAGKEEVMKKKNVPDSEKRSMTRLKGEALKLELMSILRNSKVPNATMDHFLQVMPRFEDAYKANVTTLVSPIRLKEDPQPQSPLTPFKTTPTT